MSSTPTALRLNHYTTCHSPYLLNAEQKRFDLTTARYRQGVDNYVDVLLAQEDLYAAQQNLLQFQAARLLNAIALYRALGGGWRSP